MSRCFPFPPPGYIKNAPVELELSSKKEKRKHKKKKRKKHSATNGDFTVEDGDQQVKDIDQSGVPNDGFSVGIEALPSATVSQGAIPRLQTESSGDEAFSNGVRATDPKREDKRLKSKKDLPSSSVVAAQRLQAGSSGANVLSNGVNGTMLVQSREGMKSMTEVLTGGGLATGQKRSRVDSYRDGSQLASGHIRPEEAEDSVFLNGVLSTKRKRLQADNSGDLLPPKSVPAADCKRSYGLLAGRSESDAFLHATNSTTMKEDKFCKTLVSKDGLPFNPEISEQRIRLFDSRADGACSTAGQAEIGKAREMPSRFLSNKSERQGEKSKPEVQSKGVLSSCQIKLQAESSKLSPLMNGMLTAKCDRPDKRLQTGKKLLMNNVRDSRVSILPANTLNERMISGSSIASTNESMDQRCKGTNKVILNGLSKARVKCSEADNVKGLVNSHGVQATPEQRLRTEHDTQSSPVPDRKIKADKICNPQGVLATNYKHSDSRLQAHSSRDGVLTNGVLAAHPEGLGPPIKVSSYLSSLGTSVAGPQVELDRPFKVGNSLSSPGRNAFNDTAVPKSTTARKRSFELEEQLIKEKLMKLRIPHAEQLWVTGEDEDWLKSCKQQVQLKQREQGEDQMLQVWAEGVLLPTVGITALPYVIPN